MENRNCDGGGPHTPGEVRVYPLFATQEHGGSNLILCRHCWNIENLYRVRRGDPEKWPQESWDAARVYDGKWDPPRLAINSMQAYHNDPAIKEKYIARVRKHREADELVKGKYWEDGKGCAVGCTVHSGDHSAYERELGIPETVARIEDAIFEGLPNGQAQAWPEEFLTAIPVGADLSGVWPRFALWLLSEEVIQFTGTQEDVNKAIQGVSALYRRWVAGEKPAPADFDAAEAVAARAAAWAAAWAAWAAAEEARAARAAAWAAWAARTAARAAGEAREAASWKRMAAKLLDLLTSA